MKVNQISISKVKNKGIPQNKNEEFNKIIEEQKLKFSSHAIKRLEKRNITIKPDDLQQIEKAVEIARTKGSRETLILLDKYAFIVSVKNNTIVTAIDYEEMKEKIFTQIDSTIILK
ncbi:MAG: hypothetical protein NZ891_01405 [bacterium]|nr:hypothetical protein [bacterium]MDW8163384.1 TIGR02530 family flagellar biosynthesis protein [Candidatus Omnitrophota bacterium]